jgi:hypothetical protein
VWRVRFGIGQLNEDGPPKSDHASNDDSDDAEGDPLLDFRNLDHMGWIVGIDVDVGGFAG